ncbi:MAG: Trm112 family protein [Promethearchaeota archaeon]
MKSGLLSLLACPICKFYPLKLQIFKWETDRDKFKQLKTIIEKKNIEQLNKDIQIKISIIENEIKIKDNISRSEKSLSDYIKALNNIYDDILAIEDQSNTNSKEILQIIKNELFKKIIEYKNEKNIVNQANLFEQIKFNIHILNWFLFYAEIEEGIIICEKCKRWYPIIETFPQMLPDELRKEKPEKEFFRKWKDNIKEEILLKALPFNLENYVTCPQCGYNFETVQLEGIKCPNCSFVFNR